MINKLCLPFVIGSLLRKILRNKLGYQPPCHTNYLKGLQNLCTELIVVILSLVGQNSCRKFTSIDDCTTYTYKQQWIINIVTQNLRMNGPLARNSAFTVNNIFYVFSVHYLYINRIYRYVY